MGAGAVINPDRLAEEARTVMGGIKPGRLFIHENAAVVTPECVKWEKEQLVRISSTCKGTGAALMNKIERLPDAVARGSHEVWDAGLGPCVHGAEEIITNGLDDGASILVEGAQGFDLSIDHGAYPFTTSRDCTPQSLLAWSGIPIGEVRDIYGSLRTYPIRVGNVVDEAGTTVGFSGPHYDDQSELTWDELAQMSGYGDGLQPEKTTVTGKVRRVFTFSHKQLRRFVRICGPTALFLNFANYLSCTMQGARTLHTVNGESRAILTEFVHGVERSAGVRVCLIGTGAELHDMIER
jgi:adenylosuccinate synthase